MGKYDRFFALAKEAGLEQVELFVSESRNLHISLVHGEVDEYKDNNGYSILARAKNLSYFIILILLLFHQRRLWKF